MERGRPHPLIISGHDIIPEEDPYDDHLYGEERDFVFDRTHVE